jgi:hypothetical protein
MWWIAANIEVAVFLAISLLTGLWDPTQFAYPSLLNLKVVR